MPETRIPGQQYPSGHANDGVHAITACLQDWFLALEDGTAGYRLPDPDYQRSRDRPPWTEDELDRLVRDIDAEIDQEVTRAPGIGTHSTMGPGFQRLEPAQRLALAQGLDALLVVHGPGLPAHI